MPIDDLEQCLKELIEKMPCPVSRIGVEREGESVIFTIDTPEGYLFLDSHGEGLTSLTHLFRKVVEKRWPEVPVRTLALDVNGYRRRRAETLRGIAAMLAERARTFRHDVEMEPLPPHERLVIHSFFENHPWIATESKGEGRSRHVVLKYTEKDNNLKVEI